MQILAKSLLPLTVLIAALLCGPTRADLVSHWTFDTADISGTTLNDVAGTNPGTIINGPSSVPGERGEALDFNGSNQYVNIPHSTSLNINR